MSSHRPTPLGFSGPLHSSLSNTRVSLDRFLTHHHASLRSLLSEHNADVSSKESQLASLLSELSAVASSGVRARALDASLSSQLSTAESSCRELESLALAGESSCQSLLAEHAALAAEVSSGASRLGRDSSSAEATFRTLERGQATYRSALALSFDRAAGARLRLTFRQVSSSDPARPYCFVVNLDGGDRYVVEECDPPLGPSVVRNLVDGVNAGNDFGAFVRGMRAAFVDSAEGGEGGGN